jgi:vancomycin resistance protein YoaR
LLLFLFIILATSGTLYYVDSSFQGQIYPNISIRGVPVGKMEQEEARAALEAHYASFLNEPLLLTYGDHTWNPTLVELGARVEIDQAIQQAKETGRRYSYLDNLREVAAVWEHGLELPLRISIDQQQLQSYLATLAHTIDQPPVDARLDFTASKPLPETVSAVSGRQMLINETIQDITAALQTMEPQSVAVRTRVLLPLLDDAEAARTREAIRSTLRGPLILQANDKRWIWSVDDLSHMLKVYRTTRPDHTGDQFTVTLDKTLLDNRLQTIVSSSASDVVYPRVDWNGGDLKIIREGKPGLQVDKDLARALILSKINSPNRVVQLPLTHAEPPVNEDNLHTLGIQDLLGVGRSDFTGSAAYRITNIKAGMKLLHGILVPPGEEFSFNESIGHINAANGFVEGYAIISNRTQLEWGGGICQDSTTMFRAAFWAGLPITERWGHSFYISWYDKYGYGEYGNGPGLDATIFTGGPDLRFLNDTDHWLLIQTNVDERRTLAEVRIYGTDTGREVLLEGPEIFNRRPPPAAPVYVPDPRRPRGSPRRSDTARGGMDIAFTRIIAENGTEVRRDEFLTRFKPWPNIYEINPADLGSNGRPRPADTPTPADPSPPAYPPPPPANTPPPAPTEAPPPDPPPGEEPPPAVNTPLPEMIEPLR